MRTGSFIPALAVLSVFAPLGLAQTLQFTETTTSVRPNAVSTFPTHTEHARPESWKPFAVSGAGEVVATADYDIEVTNTSSMDQVAECGLELSDVFVTDNNCWGTDFTTPQLWLFLNETIPANTTLRLTGSIELGRITIPYTPCCCGQIGDAVHTTSDSSLLFTGPFRASVQSSEWFVSPFGPAGQFLSVVDLGTVLKNELSFSMVHDLPLVAGSTGCDPLRPNSTGATGLLEAYGAIDVAQPATVLNASQLPANVFGLFALSASTQPATLSGFGNATLCLGAPIYRWFDSVGMTDGAGTLQQRLDPGALPIPGGQVIAGDTWFFQLFHRDADPVTGQPTARSTNAIGLSF